MCLRGRLVTDCLFPSSKCPSRTLQPGAGTVPFAALSCCCGGDCRGGSDYSGGFRGGGSFGGSGGCGGVCRAGGGCGCGGSIFKFTLMRAPIGMTGIHYIVVCMVLEMGSTAINGLETLWG